MKTFIILMAVVLLVIVSIIHFINANKATRSLMNMFNKEALVNLGSTLLRKSNDDFKKYSRIEDITFYIMLVLVIVILLA